MWLPISQWFLNLLEVPNPASFIQAFTEPFVETQNIAGNKLEPKARGPTFSRGGLDYFFEL